MSLVIQTFPLKDKTLYYVQCTVCKKDRILNSMSNVSNTVSFDTYKRLSGCICKESSIPAQRVVEVKPVATKKERKVMTMTIKGQVMTIKEISEMYHISPSTVRQRINAGKSEEEVIVSTKKKA